VKGWPRHGFNLVHCVRSISTFLDSDSKDRGRPRRAAACRSAKSVKHSHPDGDAADHDAARRHYPQGDVDDLAQAIEV